MKKLLGVAIFAVGMMSAQSASAGSITYTTTFGPQTLNWVDPTTSQTAAVHQFDSSQFGGATLNSMTFSFSGSLVTAEGLMSQQNRALNPTQAQVGGAVWNRGGVTSSAVSVSGSWSFDIIGPGGLPDYAFNTTLTEPSFSVSGGTRTNPFITEFSAIGSQYALDGAAATFFSVPSAFLGSDFVNVVATNTVALTMRGISSIQTKLDWVMSAVGTLSVTYDYGSRTETQSPTPAPTPAPLALLGIGLSGLIFLRRRATGGKAA